MPKTKNKVEPSKKIVQVSHKRQWASQVIAGNSFREDIIEDIGLENQDNPMVDLKLEAHLENTQSPLTIKHVMTGEVLLHNKFNSLIIHDGTNDESSEGYELVDATQFQLEEDRLTMEGNLTQREGVEKGNMSFLNHSWDNMTNKIEDDDIETTPTRILETFPSRKIP